MAQIVETSNPELAGRAIRTLGLMHRWGYAPSLDSLAEHLLGGSVSRAMLRETIRGNPEIVVFDQIVCLRGHEDLVRESENRVQTNSALNGYAREIAKQYAADLVRHCPFVQCVTLAGSVASGGYASGDDIDFDIFVESGTKYTTYLLANLLGVTYAWRYRHSESAAVHRLTLLPKVICVNVVWPDDQTRPFARQDAGLAFELSRCVPLWGWHRFREVLNDNAWLRDHTPQIFDRVWEDLPSPSGTRVRTFLRGCKSKPRLMRFIEKVARGISWSLYTAVQAGRSRDPKAKERMDFLRRVKFPYEVFQD